MKRNGSRGKYRIISKSRFLLFLTIPAVIIFTILLSIKVNAKKDSDLVLKSVFVESGDTLWNISEKYAPDNMDIRDYIDSIIKLNDLKTVMIRPGQMLNMPIIDN